MDIFSVITLLGGLTFFLYGMNVLSSGLEKLAGGKLESVLKRMTSNRWKALALGAVITVAIQSSSAMTVMLVGLVGSHIMTLGQSIGVIMGSNIGTTLTAWILSLTGIESDSFWLKMMKPEYFSAVFAFVGIVMVMMSKKKRRRDIGEIFVGFAVLMYGMKLMSGSVAPLADSPNFASILTAFNNPILGVLVGTVFTGIIQSSAASVGVLQALSLTGGVSFGMAIPIIFGQNIGTCVTSLISAIGASRNAKRVACVHVTFNVIGTVIFLILFYAADAIFNFAFKDMPIDALGIAMVHSIFNVGTTVMLVPFCGMLEKIAMMIVRDKGEEDEGLSNVIVDSRLLGTPSVAVAESTVAAARMCAVAVKAASSSLSLFEKYDEETAAVILQREDELDHFEDGLGSFLLKLSGHDVSDSDNRRISRILHTIGDFERLGDHAVNILHGAQEMRDKEINFSADAVSGLKVLFDALRDILDLTNRAYETNDLAAAARVEPLEQVIDGLTAAIKVGHIERLRRGECTIELGFVLNDLLNNCERISDHCSNIAVSIIEVEHGSYDPHGYLASVKSRPNVDFTSTYEEYSAKYAL